MLRMRPLSTLLPLKPKRSPPRPTNYLNRPPTVCKFSSSKTQPPSNPTSAYIHLPFCRKRCHYCDFPIVALGSTTSSDSSVPRISNYINLVLREIAATPKTHRPLETIFFGGGTPSLVPPPLVARIVDALRSRFATSEAPEVSIEMDPGTFDAPKLAQLVESAGVNRVSLGVQAFQEELLRACGRAHGLPEVFEAIDLVRGMENWSIDIISSLPHQTAEMWAETLSHAVNASPTHISVYDLQVEQGTKFGQLYRPGEFPLPSESQSVNFYQKASETLAKAGYHHYEISSYCKKGCECQHNLAYWNNEPFHAFGLGAASFVNGVRFSRPRGMKAYGEYVQRLEEDGPPIAQNPTDTKDTAMDVAMLSLRTARGLDLISYRRSFGDSLTSSIGRAFVPYIASGHVIAMDAERRILDQGEFDREMGDGVAFIRLSDPDGFLLSNELISIAFGVISTELDFMENKSKSLVT